MPTVDLTPNGDGFYTGFAASGCVSEWECVDDPPGAADDDATRLQLGASVSGRSSVTFTDYTAGGTINSVTIHIRYRKGLGDDATIRIITRISGTDYESGDITVPGDGAYANYNNAWATNPATSLAWTDTDLDALEAGVRAVATGDAQNRWTQIYATVDYTEPAPEPEPEPVVAAAAVLDSTASPSLYESQGLSILVFDPLWVGSAFHGDVSWQVENYSHEHRSIGGYYSASMTINDNQEKVEGWLEYGLGRHIVVKNDSLETIFEGFVNKISATLGPLQYSSGPLLDIANRSKTYYTPIDNSTDPPATGTRTQTATSNDTASQALYGIIEGNPGSEGKSATEATQIVGLHLAESAYPPTSRDSNLSGDSGPSVSIEILGYWHWLGTYFYSSSTTGSQNLSAKIQAIVAACPQSGIFSSDYSYITSNTTQVTTAEDGTSSAMAIIEELNKLGDSSNNRYNVGFYADRKIVYAVAPSTIDYLQRITDNRGVTNILGGIVKPWNVTPARWLFYPDFMIGRNPPLSQSTLRRDTRAGFIETVRFDAPYDLSVNGQKVSNLDQMLARLNLVGSGA